VIDLDPHPPFKSDGAPEPDALANCCHDAHLDALCEQLAWWLATRRFYGGPRAPVSLLGKLGKRTRPLRPGGPDAACSAELSALHIAMVAQPADALDRVVFELNYLHRVRNVKVAASALGIGRQHWYTLLREFRQRIFNASREILAANERELRSLRDRGAPQLSRCPSTIEASRAVRGT
jgi:hypothetical protein